MNRCLLLGLAALAISTGSSSAGWVQGGDFAPGARIITYDNLGLPFVNGTPLVISGDSYITYRDFHLLYNNTYGQFALGLTGGALATDSGHETTRIYLGTDAAAAGIEIGAAASWSATVNFYDAAHNLLASGSFVGSGVDHAFAGWNADTGLVHEMEIIDTSPAQQNFFFKDLTTGTVSSVSAVSEPSSFALLASGTGILMMAGWGNRNRKPTP